jgi:hypothetical protein
MSAPTNDRPGDEPLAPERLVRLEAALAGLDRRSAPRILKERVARVLAADEAELAERAEAACGVLEPLRAPPELRERVVLELGNDVPIARLVRGLSRQSAPHVLRRLVAEELADDRAAVARAMRGLPRLVSPAHGRAAEVLADVRAETELRAARRFGALGELRGPRAWRLAAAAVVLLAVGAATLQRLAPEDQQRPERPAFRFQRTYANSPEELSPMARGMLLGMAPDALREGGAR